MDPVFPLLFALFRGAKTISMDMFGTKNAESADVMVNAASAQSKMDFLEMTLIAQDCMHDEHLLIESTMTDAMEKEVNKYRECAAEAVAVTSSPVKSNTPRKVPVVSQSTMAKKEPFDDEHEDDRVTILGESSTVARMPSQDEIMEEAHATVQNEEWNSGRKRSAQEMNTSGKMNDEDMKQQIQILKNKYGKRFM